MDNEKDKTSKGRQCRGDAHYARKCPEKLHRGDNHKRTKISDEKVREMRARYTGARGQIVQFAKEYGVSRDLVFRIVHGQHRKSAGWPDALKLVVGPGT